jgi:putative ATPase
LLFARRLIILASEDIGLANPTALVMANNTFQAITTVGMPEARIILSQCVLYLATSAKSNSAYMAINKAITKVKETGNLEVPLHLRNAPTKLMKEIGYGKDYKYAHDYTGNFSFQEFMPDEISNFNTFKPSKNKREEQLRLYLQELWKEKYRF